MIVSNKKVLFFILLITLILRAGMLYLNVQKHPSFFYNKVDAIKREINSDEKPFLHNFGAEIANIAYALVCKGEGFSSPFGGHTGPTAWIAPGMVTIYAVAFYLFGCFSFGSILFLFVLSLLLSMAMVFLIYGVTQMLFNNKKLSCLCALLFALSPHDIWFFQRNGQQDFNIYSFLFILNFFLFLKYFKTRAPIYLILFSLASAIAMLCNPVFVLPTAVCLFVYFIVLRKKGMASVLRQTVLSMVIMCLLILPYIFYQKHNFGKFVFIKSNGPFELYLGNVPDFKGSLVIELFEKYHPSMNTKEYLLYRSMGEDVYVHSKFLSFLKSFNIGRFIKYCYKRFLHFFFIFSPGVIHSPQQGILLYIKYFFYAIPGLSMVLYLLLCFKNITVLDTLIYFYIIAYALPYIFMGFMWRYSFPVAPLSMVLLGRSLYLLSKKGRAEQRALY